MRRVLSILCAVVAVGVLSPARADDGGGTVRVGSKKFTESVILGEMTRVLAQAAGYPASHRRELGGTRVLWGALLANEIDVYPEYTGTLIQTGARASRPANDGAARFQ